MMNSDPENGGSEGGGGDISGQVEADHTDTTMSFAKTYQTPQREKVLYIFQTLFTLYEHHIALD